MSFRTWIAIGFFLFGSTFLWMTRAFLADAGEGTGAVWSLVQVLVLLAIAGFSVTAWGVFRGASWWEAAAIVSAAVGLVATVPYVVGIFQVGDQADAGVQMNIAIHVVGAACVLAVALVPLVHDWFAKRI